MREFAKRLLDAIVNITKTLEEAVDSRAKVLRGVRRSVQLDGYTCGVQSAFVILSYFGKARSIKNVTRELGTTEDGTDQHQTRNLLVKRGLGVRRVQRPTIRTLQMAIDRGCPVLVLVDDEEHWAVVYGYGKQSVYMVDSALNSFRCCLSVRRFLKRWDKWAMFVNKE